MSVQRKSSPSTSRSTVADNDLEITAELPVLDVAAYEAATTEARTNNTDTWIAPAPPAVAEPEEPELSSLDATAVNKALVVEEEEQRSYDEKRIQLEASLHSLSDNLREVEDSLRRKAERVTEIETALATANEERANAESQAKQLQAELEEARAATKVVDAKVAELQRGIEERDAANQTLRSRDRELEEKLALSDKALALVQRDLTSAHTQAASYYESLQSMEGRRGIFQDISTTLYWEVDERDAKLNHAEGQLAAAVARSRDLESSLIDRSARIAKLEKEMSGLGATVSDRDNALRESSRSGDDLKRNVDGLTTNLIERDERIRSLVAAAAEQATVLAERQAAVDKGAAERATLVASINSLEGRLEEANKRVFELETAWRAAQARIEEMDAATAILKKRAEQLEAELGTVRTELQQRVTALQEAGTERGEHMAHIAAGETRAQELEARMQEQQEAVRLLQADSNASVARAKELENDLRAAEDTINRLEADVRGRSARLDELEKTNQEWRATVEEARSALTDRDSLIRRLEEETANSAVLLGAIQQRLDTTGTHDIAPEGDKRLLIRTEGDSDVVHVLGRKTTVGRTPDNDLQIDAKFISRHHAVILAGPAHTIIEDLNSTNGVLVTGKRITRQTLKDGDSVVIGKALFRFAVRPAIERRF